jgi:dihydroorotate dehydrogenase (fumarate)
MTTLVGGLERWLEARNIESLDRIRGKMRRGAMRDPTAFDRANYINVLSTSDLHRSRDLDL